MLAWLIVAVWPAAIASLTAPIVTGSTLSCGTIVLLLLDVIWKIFCFAALAASSARTVEAARPLWFTSVNNASSKR